MQQQTIYFFAPVYDGDMKRGRPARTNKTNFAKRVIELREAAGLSQRQVAAHLGIAQSSYANWERFDVALKPHQLVALAEIFGVSVEELIAEQGKKRRGGPNGKMRQIFEAASRLPRAQQQKVVDVLQPFVAQHAQNE